MGFVILYVTIPVFVEIFKVLFIYINWDTKHDGLQNIEKFS